MTHTRIVRNSIPSVRRRIPQLVQNGVTAAARELRDELKDKLESGDLPIQSDTEALVQSLTVETSGANGTSSDFAMRRAAAKGAYLGNPSRWRDAIQQGVSEDAYSEAHFEERTAEEDAAKGDDLHATAAVLTMLWWGFLFEQGHSNTFTGRYEQRPWMAPVALTFGAQRVADAIAHELAGL